MSMMTPHNRIPRLLVALTAAAGLGLAACGGPTTTAAAPPSTSDSMPMPSSGSPAAAPPASAPVATNSVTIKNFAFAPASVTVKVGTTITWTNTDQDAHTVTAKSGPFSSAALNTGATYKYTFTKAGTYNYFCTIHPFMTAVVVVTP
jgi:plastocyanin